MTATRFKKGLATAVTRTSSHRDVDAPASVVALAIKQKAPFASLEEEVALGLQMAAARVWEPWAHLLKTEASLTPSQYNVLRVLRGARPDRLACSEIGSRLVAKDPDITRLVDRLAVRKLVDRTPSTRDRRVVEIGITAAGLAVLAELDPAVRRFPTTLLAPLGRAKLTRLRDLLSDLVRQLGALT